MIYHLYSCVPIKEKRWRALCELLFSVVSEIILFCGEVPRGFLDKITRRHLSRRDFVL